MNGKVYVCKVSRIDLMTYWSSTSKQPLTCHGYNFFYNVSLYFLIVLYSYLYKHCSPIVANFMASSNHEEFQK